MCSFVNLLNKLEIKNELSYLKKIWCVTGGGGGGGGAGTFLMEHMPKSTQRVGGCISYFVTKKRKRGTPSNI